MEWFAENGWLAWVGLALILAAIEAASVDFFFIMFAVGAVAGAIAAALGLSFPLQVIIFVVVALLLVFTARPLLKRRFITSADPTIGVGANVGRTAVVTEEVTSHGGRIKLSGEIWSARSRAGESIEPGQQVRVVSIEGATAVVTAAWSPEGEEPWNPFM